MFDELIEVLRADNAKRDVADVAVVLLRDLIDRGRQSAGVVARAMRPLDWARFFCIKDSHEAAMEGAIAGDKASAELWRRVGGHATLLSCGLSDALLTSGSIEEIIAEARRRVSAEILDPIAQRQICYRSGDHFVRVGVPLKL